MSDDPALKQELHELRELLVAQSKKGFDAQIESSSKVLRWLQTIISIAVVAIGLGINWGVTTTEIKSQVQVLQQNVSTNTRDVVERIGKVENDIHELQIKQAVDDQTLLGIKNALEEIKKDVKALTERRLR